MRVACGRVRLLESRFHDRRNGGILYLTTSRSGAAFIVSGSTIANADLTITDVQTVAGRSGGQGFSTITFKTLAQPIQVLNGQQVLARVTITFS